MTMAPDTDAAIDDAAASRFAMYRVLADALEFPTQEFHESARAGIFRDTVEGILESLPYRIEADPAALELDDEYLDFQAEYIRLFDVGTVRPPCPLYGGEWGMARRTAMEDALRFYRFFGMKMAEDAHELPDHVTVELEFMQMMTYTEGTARARGADELPLVRAQRDFLTRHLAKWWPLLRRKIPSQQPSPFYDALTALTDRFIAADLAYLTATAKRSPGS